MSAANDFYILLAARLICRFVLPECGLVGEALVACSVLWFHAADLNWDFGKVSLF